MRLETERLLLRPWELSDAEALYRYASDERVGPAAGWAAHTSVENSREIIETVLSEPETYAVVLRETGEPVGSVGLMVPQYGTRWGEGEGELGYWIGVPFWGRGLIPEAMRPLIRRGFEDFGLHTLWCGYFEGNGKSRRVQEKCGFLPHHTAQTVWPALGDSPVTEHFTQLTRARYELLLRRSAQNAGKGK